MLIVHGFPEVFISIIVFSSNACNHDAIPTTNHHDGQHPRKHVPRDPTRHPLENARHRHPPRPHRCLLNLQHHLHHQLIVLPHKNHPPRTPSPCTNPRLLHLASTLGSGAHRPRRPSRARTNPHSHRGGLSSLRLSSDQRAALRQIVALASSAREKIWFSYVGIQQFHASADMGDDTMRILLAGDRLTDTELEARYAESWRVDWTGTSKALLQL